ncbi:MAG: vancomycin resistance histidine kinase VanS [Clostridiales bacterium]|nr:vancomycin resistance histidine kinase VanS [Clostridiales bacterium]
MARKLLFRFLLSLFLLVVGFIVCYWLANVFFRMFIWHDRNPLYHLLKWFEENILLWGSFFLLIGGAVISYIFIAKPLRYLDEIIDASDQLAEPSQRPIILSEELKEVQDELNLVREQAIKQAASTKEAEQRKNDLIVYLAHDLKTPLTSVIGYLSLLRDEKQISDELRERYIGIALTKAERLEDLVNEFFDITRFSLTHLTIERSRINLSFMLKQIASEFEPILAEKGLQWQLDIEESLYILGDPDKIGRVFDNLVRNAVAYSYANHMVTLSATTEQEQAVITLQNTGKTIPSEKLGRLFDQFFRLDAARATSTGGAGLGLAIAKEIVELHHGQITAASENESITFTVRLPL